MASNTIQMKTAVVLGAGGFIGSHMVKRLKSEGYFVRGVDLKMPDFAMSAADKFIVADLRNPRVVEEVLLGMDEVYQFAADMGGAGYIFTGEHDADVMYNSSLININVVNWAAIYNTKKVFYSSSACMYPQQIQEESNNPGLKESDAYPGNPDSEYGWEKLFSERLYLAYHRNYGLNVRIARFHNIFGPEGTYKGGKEKAPAAICRKVAEAVISMEKTEAFVRSMGGETEGTKSIEIWGDGMQTRSFLYVDECIEGVRRLMESDFTGPVNIGSDEMVSINHLARMAMQVAGKDLTIKHITGPIGVRGRNSDNTLIFQKLGWKPSQPLYDGLEKTYNWIKAQCQ
jgi:GDP-D-mannose 3',5'-epimerase